VPFLTLLAGSVHAGNAPCIASRAPYVPELFTRARVRPG
jgi:hypothetical protein